MINRRTFIKNAAGAALLTAGCIHSTSSTIKPRKLQYLGWQVGVTYQSMAPEGLDRDHFLRLLDEMASNRMNLLSLMMQSYGYFDPDHDGYAWPVQNPKLQPYRDKNAINARPDQEFLRKIIQEAATRNIAIQLFMNWGIWNPDFVKAAYPESSLQIKEDNSPSGWLHCPDSPGAWQMGLDESTDLLQFYNHPNVVSYSFERISYSGKTTCYCPYTKQAFQEATGQTFEDADARQREEWKTDQICRYLTQFSEHLRKIHPGIEIGLHTQCSRGWGHDPKRLQECGITYLMPHTIQFPTTKQELYFMLDYLAPNPCILHFCSRDRRPENYNLWIKTPEIIEEALQWVHDYPGDNVIGIVFFNEPATSPVNKEAVYQGLCRFAI